MVAHKGAFLSVMAEPLISAKTSGRAGFNLPQKTRKTENKTIKSCVFRGLLLQKERMLLFKTVVTGAGCCDCAQHDIGECAALPQSVLSPAAHIRAP